MGLSREVKSLAQASRLAVNGDTLEVDAGEYAGDVAVWTQDRLTIRATGGRVRLVAGGRNAEGKAIWVVRGGDLLVEGVDFSGARVTSRNGAGIRFERGRLALRDCGFFDNENGILTAGDPNTELDIAGCEFGHNGYGDGYSHNLYVGAIAKLTVTGSYFHHARVGHLLKSRAAANHILYNRLTDEENGRASYELEFPNGGIARVMGNLIQQGLRSDNPVLVSYGAEGYLPRANALYLAHNTLIDDGVAEARFLAIQSGERKAIVANNILVGEARFETPAPGEFANNIRVPRGDFAGSERYDFRLRRRAAAFGKAIRLAPVAEGDLVPRADYIHPRTTRAADGLSLQPGALQAVVD